jgi:Xaa-Pro aminopeptidase
MRTEKITTLRNAMKEAGVNFVALIPGSNLKYLTGFTPMLTKRVALGLFPLSGDPVFVLPSLEAPNARLHLGDIKIYEWDDANGAAAAVAEALKSLGASGNTIAGVEYTAMRVNDLKIIEQAAVQLGITLDTKDITPLIGSQRMVKSAEEIELMREAGRIIDKALEASVAQIREGMTEKELSAICAKEIIRAGGDGESFESFAAFGPNTANPHHEPGDKKLQKGELVMIDFGALYKGYASDITRCFAFGEPGEKAREIYETVRKANEAGKNVIKPGVTGEKIDQAARGLIANAGYGRYFLHRTGHGLGMEIFPVHEHPNIMEGSVEPLPVGTTFTVEPGVYVEGECGVRIEDDVVVTENGYESFTKFPRELIVLPE